GVAGLLLAPDQLGALGVAAEDAGEHFGVEGVELLDADEGDVAPAELFAAVGQLEVDLAGAEDEALDVLAVGGAGFEDRVVDHLPEAAVHQLVDRAGGRAEEALGGEDDEGLAEVAADLAAQEVEHLRAG